jgi:antitoxin component YwqK of YwqJK toxin-antitoxin module
MKKKLNKRDSEGRFHGNFEERYHGGIVMWSAYYHHGKLNGVLTWYYPSGKIWTKRNLQHSVPKGIEKEWGVNENITDKKYHLVIR